LQQHTGAAFLQYVEASIPFVDYLLSRAKRFTDVSTPAGQADCVKRLLPLLRKIDNHVERWGYMATLAEQIGIPPEVLGREMTARPTDRKPTPQPPSEVIPGRRVQARPPSEEYALVHLLYHDSGCRVAVQDQVSVAQFQDATLGALYALFLRLMPQCTEATWLQTLHDAASPTQASLLAKMAMEPLLSEAAARPQELRQYLAKMRQRSLKAQLQHLRAQLQQAHEATDQQRLLQECDRLGKELGEYAQNEAH
jgi:DNA primase